MPKEFQAQLATLVKAAPEGDDWLHEVKFDGYRIGCRIDGDEVQLLSRRGNDWTGHFPEIGAAAKALPTRRALLDGEVAVLLPDGRTSFQALQNAAAGGARGRLVYFVFDLLHEGGQDLSERPLEERKARLAELIARAPEGCPIRYSDHVVGGGPAVFAEACRRGLEGIVSKRRDAPYRADRNAAWVKTKCVQRQELVIGGFTDPEGSRAGIGALLVGAYDDEGRLAFSGKVGTGFTQKSAAELRRQLDALEQKTPPFSPPPTGWLGKNAHWTRPDLVCEVVFAEWTDDGKVRHASFQGLRADKSPREVRRERPADETGAPAPSGTAAKAPRVSRAAPKTPPAPSRAAPASRKPAEKGAPEVAGVRLSHPERILFPDLGLTKQDLARFYEEIGAHVVPHLEGRPLTLVRCPEGAGTSCFYMKHSHVWAPEALRRVRIQEKTKVGEYLVADSVAAVVALVQMNVLEIHTWNSRADDVERPDRVVFDLDPGPHVTWPQVLEGARLVRGVLSALGLESWVKTTGGVGLHVVVPLVPERAWDDCFAFSRAVATLIAREHRERYTISVPKAGREAKVLIDYLRNNRTNTSVAAYSTRARPGAPVSTPLAWDELSPRVRSDHYTVSSLPQRLRSLRADPWAGYFRCKQRLTRRMLDAVAAL